MANTFLKAQGKEVGHSMVEESMVAEAAALLAEFPEKIMVAHDFIKDDPKNDETFRYLDIGPESVKQFEEVLSTAKTIFWNGSLGYTEDQRFAVATKELAQFLAKQNDAHVVIAGGDTVEIITELGLRDAYSFVSTGGGAALEFLSGEPMPGLAGLVNKKKTRTS